MAAALKRGECAAQAFVILICIILCFDLACNLTFIVKGRAIAGAAALRFRADADGRALRLHERPG